MIAVQYLEPGPHLAAIAPEAARARLRAAFDRLPITCVILGWDLPDVLRSVCGQEAERAGAQLYLWHPLLTSDTAIAPRPEWCVIGLNGTPVAGYQGLPEFTFICPNRPAAREAALGQLDRALLRYRYDGVFLDRIRYPSPAADPMRCLGCFCEDCRQVAAAEELDLQELRSQIIALLALPERAEVFLRTLLDPLAPASDDPALAALRALLAFRARSVTRFVHMAAEAIRARGLAVGLDCFSPALTWMVGQDLAALAPCGDWVKVMTYGHTLGPAGLPFELRDLADWLSRHAALDAPSALACLSLATHMRLPETRDALERAGVPPDALADEIHRARQAGVSVLLAGIELVDGEDVTRLSGAQIAADLAAFRAAAANGLALSWDLWRMPDAWLDLVRRHFCDAAAGQAG